MVAVKKMKMSTPRLSVVGTIFYLLYGFLTDGPTGAISMSSNSKLMKLTDYFHQEPMFTSPGRGA